MGSGFMHVSVSQLHSHFQSETEPNSGHHNKWYDTAGVKILICSVWIRKSSSIV